jgi:16S rRNA G966 N2-methylase RsmD
LKRRKLKRELRKLFSDFVPPSFIVDELKNDYDEILRLEVDDYLIDGIWRSHKPDGKPWAGKRLIWHFQPHLWDVRTLGKSLMSEVWGKDCDIFERALNNLVAGKSITYDRIIREFVFAGVGVPSQIHAGFAKAVFKHFGGKSVFDPFAGWGGRMLAAASLGLRYTACDLSRKTVDGLNNMAKFIGFDCDISTNDCFDISIPNADIMFTSPPFGSEEYIDSNSSVDLGKLIEVTNHIPVRILHLNRHMANLTGWDLVPIQARVRAAGDSSQEFLAVKIRDDCSTCEFSTGVKCSLSRCPKLPDGT